MLNGAAVWLACSIGAHAQPQPEFSTGCGANTRLDAGLQTYHTTGCEIGPVASDADTFVFSGTAGERIRLTASSTGAVGPNLALQAPGGGSAGSASCPAGPCAAILDTTLTVSGNYTVTVTDGGANATGAYILQFDRLMPLYCAPVPREGAPFDDTLGPITDVDVLRIEGRAGDTIRLEVATAGGLDLRVELLAPAGTTLRDQSCGGPCTVMLDETLAETGTYHALVSEDGSDADGSYSVTLSCLAGACLGDTVVDNLGFGVDTSTLAWDAVADLNATYEVARGDLSAMRGGGSFAAAGFECLGAPTMMTGWSDSELPASGAGFVYVARALGSDGVDGNADTRWGPAQICGRELASCATDPGRSCAAPIPIGAGGLVAMDNTCGAPNVVDKYFDITNPGDCSNIVSGPIYPGPEVIYEVTLGTDNDIVATLSINPGSDLALLMIRECGNGLSCIVGSDQVGLGVTEEIDPGPLPEGTYYVYVDSYYSTGPSSCGDYTLDFGGTITAKLVDFAID